MMGNPRKPDHISPCNVILPFMIHSRGSELGCHNALAAGWWAVRCLEISMPFSGNQCKSVQHGRAWLGDI